MLIEHASAADFREIADLWEASVRATHRFLREADILFFRPLVEHEFLAAVRVFCIRSANGSIAGFTGLSDDIVELLFVHPQHYGQGVGKRLLEYATDELGIRRVDLNEQNTGALTFYERFGFVVTGRSDTDGFGKPYPILHLELRRPA